MPRNLVGRLVLFIMLFNGLFFAIHFFIVSQSLSDGTHINPNATHPWQSDGMEIVVVDSARNELRDGDIILEVEGRPIAAWMDRLFCLSPSCGEPAPPQLRPGAELTYTILRAGEVLSARSMLRPYPFWRVISGSWGTLTFTLVTYLMFLVLLLKQPNESSILAMALMAAGFLGAMGWMFALASVDLLYRHTFWLYHFGILVCYFIGLGGLLHFALVFPKPLPIVSRYRWLLVFPYIGGLGIFWLVMLAYSLTTQNKLLWMARIYEVTPLIDALWYGLAGLAIIQNYRSLKLESERRQVYTVVVSIALALLLSIVLTTLPAILFGESLVSGDSIAVISLIIPISIVISIRRYQLWAIDPIINRALVYLSLSAIVIGLYIVIVVITGSILRTGMSLPVSIFATGVVAVLFQPLRDRLQRGVNRLLYGERDDPAAVLTRLAHQLETADTPTAILPNLVQTIARTLKIPYTAIWLPVAADRMKPVAVWGEASDPMQTIPLTYQNEAIGHLVVAPRGPQERFNRHEQDLLATIAALTASTVRAVQLSDELRRSRQRLVLAREEERRRLRRDLHDDLAPSLAGLALTATTIADVIPADPAKAVALAENLNQSIRASVSSIRQLVYDLRPSTLDDLGLVAAIRERAEQFSRSEGDLRVMVNADDLPPLPAAVEVAAYRIVQEALMNVARHAQAQTCHICLKVVADLLEIEIVDDGIGLGEAKKAGVGLQSIAERAAELGGTHQIEQPLGGGTRVFVRLPAVPRNGDESA